MRLRLTSDDGPTTIYLSDTSPAVGCTYFPSSPEPDETEVSETATVALGGTASAIRTLTNGVERLFALARLRAKDGAGPRVWVEYQAVTGDAFYRSELRDGRLSWSEQPGLRRLSGSAARVQVAVHWTRQPFWEGAETQIALSASGQGATTGYVTLTNNHSSNWAQMAAAQVGGSLPAPLKLEVGNADASSRPWSAFYLGANAWAAPATFAHGLLGTAAEGGASASWTGSSSHTTPRFIWKLSSAFLAATAGRFMRLVLAPSTDWVDTYAKPWLYSYVGSVYQPLWEGDEALVDDDKLVDLGALPIPPGGYDLGTGLVALALSCRSSASRTVGVRHVQVTPAGAGMFRVLRTTGFQYGQYSAVIDDGIDNRLYVHDPAGDDNLVLRAAGAPLTVWPNRVQRVYVLADGGTSYDAAWTLRVKAWYRPRVATI